MCWLGLVEVGGSLLAAACGVTRQGRLVTHSAGEWVSCSTYDKEPYWERATSKLRARDSWLVATDGQLSTRILQTPRFIELNHPYQQSSVLEKGVFLSFPPFPSFLSFFLFFFLCCLIH